MGHIRNIEDLLSFISRRGLVIALCLILAVALAVAWALRRPDSFTASTR